MINYLTTNANQRTSILVDKKAFEDIINTLPKFISGIKVNILKTKIDFFQKENNVEILLEIKVAKEEKIDVKIKEVREKIEFHSFLLLDKNPKNIIIFCVGRY